MQFFSVLILEFDFNSYEFYLLAAVIKIVKQWRTNVTREKSNQKTKEAMKIENLHNF